MRPARLPGLAGAGAQRAARGHARACALGAGLVRRSRLDRGRAVASPRRSRTFLHDAGGGRANRAAAGRGGQCAHASALAQTFARHTHRGAARAPGVRMRLWSHAQCRSAFARALAAGQCLSARVARTNTGRRGALQLLARRIALRIPRRNRAAARRWHARNTGVLFAPPDRGRRRAALCAWRAAASARADRARARTHRRVALRGLLSHGARSGRVRARARHLVPGARVGGQFGGLLLPGHHRGGPGARQSAVRAFHQPRAQRAARHRCRFRARAARRSHSIPLRQIRARPRGAHRGGHQLSPALGAARRGQGARLRSAMRRPDRQKPPMVGRAAHQRTDLHRERTRPAVTRGPALDRTREYAGGVSAPSVAACGRLRHRARPPVASGPDRKRRDGRALGHRMGQGRSRRARAAQGRCARAGHAQRHPRRAGPLEPAPWAHLPHARHPAQRRPHLRHDLRGRYRRRVPDRKPRANEHAAATAPAHLLRPRHRGGDRAPRADPGRHGASLPQTPFGRRTRQLPKPRGGARAQTHAGRTDLSGTGDADRHPGGRLHARRGRCAAPRDGGLEAQRRPGAVLRPARGPSARQGLHARICRVDLQADPGLWRIWLPRKPCGEFCAAGLRQQLAQTPSSRCLSGGHAQCATARVLFPLAIGAGCAPPWRGGAARRCDGERLAQHAGTVRTAPGPAGR